MNVILASGQHDQAFIDQRCDRGELRAAQGQRSRRPSTRPRTPSASPACRPRRCAGRRALLGRPKKTSILFEKGVIWSGTQNEAVMSSLRQPRAAARQHRPARPRVRPPGRPPERLHVRLRLAAPAGRRRPAQPLAGAREGHDRRADLRGLQPAAHAAADHAAQAVRRARAVHRRHQHAPVGHRRRSPTSSCRPPPGASTPTRARTSSGACASTRSSTTAPGEVASEYLIFARIAQRLAAAPQARRRRRVAVRVVGGRLQRDAPDLGGQGARPRPDHAASSCGRWAPTASSSRSSAAGQQADGHRAHLRGRASPPTTARPGSSPATSSGPTPTRWPSCPSRSSPTRSTRSSSPRSATRRSGSRATRSATSTTSPRTASRSWSSSCTPTTPTRPG